MAIIDREGRLFGAINLVDALCAVFLLGLIPVAYASLLLFRPARPHIRSVERAEVNKEERRIANGLVIRQKVKVRGDHLTPNLRAFIDDVPAIGFTWEDPTSADVIVGDVPLGTHDLILYDGVQEVARAPKAVSILPAPGSIVRVVGTLIDMDEATAKSLHEGQRFEAGGEPVAELFALGDVEPDRHRVAVGAGHIDAPVSGLWQRSVVLKIHCEPDPDESVCRVGTTTLGDPQLKVLSVPGAPKELRVRIADIVPDAPPKFARATIHVTASPEVAAQVRPGDRDVRGNAADDRTASVLEVRRGSSADVFTVVLKLGVDRSGDGWRYKSQDLEPGKPFSLVTERYALAGSLTDVLFDAR
jgi:hypothetical protein